MDPNETLERIRELVKQVSAYALDPMKSHELALAVDDLDEWLARGGFLPEDWRVRNL